MKEETKERLIEVIKKSKDLGWIENKGDRLVMTMEDVEKTIIGVLEPDYIDNLLKVKEKLDQYEKLRKSEEKRGEN